MTPPIILHVGGGSTSQKILWRNKEMKKNNFGTVVEVLEQMWLLASKQTATTEKKKNWKNLTLM